MINTNDVSVVASRNNNLDNRLQVLARNVKDEVSNCLSSATSPTPDELEMLGIASPTSGVRYFPSIMRPIGGRVRNRIRLTDVRLSM
jgi:hypothetical protein